jgi:hypothetical protein
MPQALGRSRLFLAGVVLLSCASCNDRPKLGSGGSAPQGPGASQENEKKPSPSHPLETTPLPPDGPEIEEPEPPRVKPQDAVPEAGDTGFFELGEIQDAGPAAPMTAHNNGIYFVTKVGGMFVAKRDGTNLIGINRPREDFFRYGRGPAISKNYAYWISSQGNLTRALLSGGSPETLTPARSGARVSVIHHEEDVVFYLADEGPHLRAMLYTERHKAMRISPDASDVTSLAVVEGGAFPRALMLEGRSGMSPLHARTVRLRAKGPELGPDEVIWVGPGSQPLTEVRATSLRGTGGIAFIATAKSVPEFGLATLEISPSGLLAEEPSWRLYQNGIDPAPSDSVHACGKTFVLFAQPTTRVPHAPQEIRIAELDRHHLKNEVTLVRARAVNEISVAPLTRAADGASFLVAWTAEHRTWGMVVRCKSS